MTMVPKNPIKAKDLCNEAVLKLQAMCTIDSKQGATEELVSDEIQKDDEIQKKPLQTSTPEVLLEDTKNLSDFHSNIFADNTNTSSLEAYQIPLTERQLKDLSLDCPPPPPPTPGASILAESTQVPSPTQLKPLRKTDAIWRKYLSMLHRQADATTLDTTSPHQDLGFDMLFSHGLADRGEASVSLPTSPTSEENVFAMEMKETSTVEPTLSARREPQCPSWLQPKSNGAKSGSTAPPGGHVSGPTDSKSVMGDAVTTETAQSSHDPAANEALPTSKDPLKKNPESDFAANKALSTCEDPLGCQPLPTAPLPLYMQEQPQGMQEQPQGMQAQPQAQPQGIQAQQAQPAPIIINQQNQASNNNMMDGATGWPSYFGGLGGWPWGMEQREGDQQDVKYLVLATFLMLFALCNPILLLCAIPACIGALIGLSSGHTDSEDGMMMGVPMMEEEEGEGAKCLGSAMNALSQVCSTLGLVFCCFTVVTFVILVIFLVAFGMI